MLLRKPPIWNLQPGLVAWPWREHWRGAKAVFPFWEADGGSIYPAPRFTLWGLNNGAARRLTRYGPAVYFPGSSANEVETADDSPIAFASGRALERQSVRHTLAEDGRGVRDDVGENGGGLAAVRRPVSSSLLGER